MKVLLATAFQEVDSYIKQNATHYEIVGEIPYRKPLLDKIEELKPDVLILSMLLPGEEDMKQIVFEAQRLSNCRIILLTGNSNSAAITTDMFLLGVRDFIPDPIQPNLLLQSITSPATYAEATKEMKRVPNKDASKLNTMVNKLIPKHPLPPASDLSEQALLLINGIMALLEKTPTKSLEENLTLIEQGIGELILKKARDLYE